MHNKVLVIPFRDIRNLKVESFLHLSILPWVRTDEAVFPSANLFFSSGDGMYAGNGGIAGDPLTTVRLVRKVLSDKIEKANQVRAKH